MIKVIDAVNEYFLTSIVIVVLNWHWGSSSRFIAALFALVTRWRCFQQCVANDVIGVAAHGVFCHALVVRLHLHSCQSRRWNGRWRQGYCWRFAAICRWSHWCSWAAISICYRAARNTNAANAILIAWLSLFFCLAAAHVRQQRLIQCRGDDNRIFGRLANKRVAFQLLGLLVWLLRSHHHRKYWRMWTRRQPAPVRWAKQRVNFMSLLCVVLISDRNWTRINILANMLI